MRNPEFDREQVLRAAMHAFMAKGYSNTSMQDLTKATGLHPGSLYCAFNNKRGLLLAALGQYQQDRSQEFQQFFVLDRKLLVSLKAYLDHIVLKCLSCEVDSGCLLTKALNELAQQDDEVQHIISASLAKWHQALSQIFAQAQQNGELNSKRDSEHLARYFAMGIYGLRTFAHTHTSSNTLQQLANQLFADVCA